MSIQESVVTALNSIADLLDGDGDARVYPEAAPQDAARPFVIYVRKSRNPLATLLGGTGDVNSEIIFECYADSKAAALAVADEVRAAIVAALVTTLPIQYEIAVTTEDYLPQTMEYMEPVGFSFWHQ